MWRGLFALAMTSCVASINHTANDAAIDATHDLRVAAIADAPPPPPLIDGGDTNDAALSGTGVFVAAGYGSRRVRSLDDGATWVDDQSVDPMGGDDNDLLRTILYAKGKFYALGYHSLSSTDGKTWVDSGVTLAQWVGSAIYVGNQFVIVGGYGMRATSPDAVTLTRHDLDTTATHPHDSLVFADNVFVAVNDAAKLSHSADGVTWAYAAGDRPGTGSSEVAYGAGVFIGVGMGKVVLSTDHGASYTSVATLGATTSGLVYAQSKFLAIGTDHVYTSTDGRTWATHTATGLRPGQVAYGHGTYVLVAGKSRFRSHDGITWDAPITDGTNSLEMIAFGAL